MEPQRKPSDHCRHPSPPFKIELMRRVRAGAYVHGDYLIRYAAWLDESWDGVRERYRPWHVYRRASRIQKRILLECTATLDEAKAFVLANFQEDRSAGQPGLPRLRDSA